MLTIRGRTSGRPREVAVAVVRADERRWVVGAYGNVNWVRNLRRAGEATLHERHGPVRVQAIELSIEEAADFFRKPFRSFAEGLPLAARVWVPSTALEDPDGAARSFPVFELIPTD
jgi:deazaflavin-dependent oxidoreductase (nitroreductase family)